MFAALLWGLDGAFIRPQLAALPVLLVVCIEYSIGSLVLAPFVYRGWHRIRHLTTLDWAALLWIAVIGGLLGTAMITKAFFAALTGEITFATLATAQQLQPIIALGLAVVLLRERLSAAFYAGAGLAIGAASILAFGGSDMAVQDVVVGNRGALFALLAAVAFGSTVVFGKRVVNHLDFASVAALRFGLTALFAGILVLMNDEIWLLGAVTGIQWRWLTLVAVVSGAFAALAYYYGLRRLTASTATIAELAWLPIALIVDYGVYGNALTAWQWLAIPVLGLGMYMATRLGANQCRQFSAPVIPGGGTGRSIGLATTSLNMMNLDIEHGVYIVKVCIEGKWYWGLLHFGYRETLRLGPSAEMYLLHFVGNLYGVTVEVELVQKIREVQQFASPEELRAAIRHNIVTLESYIARHSL